MKRRVGILGIQHESNTFLPGRTTLDDFERDVYAWGPAVFDRMGHAHHEFGGFFAGLATAGLEAVPLLFARAVPSGVIRRDTADALVDRALAALDAAGPLDGLLVAPHGAAVAEGIDDFDGHWLAAVRARVGPGVPVVCTIDPHANLSAAMVAACDSVIAYRTNPHVDQRARGQEAAALLVRHLNGEVCLACAAAFPPTVINIERQRTAVEPCAGLYRHAAAVAARPGVLSASVVLGFPYADVSEMGTAFVVTCDGDAVSARRFADELADATFADRHHFVGRLIDVDTAVSAAAAFDGLTVLLDMGDNVGGGGPADSTVLIAALSARGVGPSVATLFDAAAVTRARAVGVGASAYFEIGDVARPLRLHATVARLTDGRFSESQPRHGGATHFDTGPTAVLTTVLLTLIVTSRRYFPVSLQQYAACGLSVADFRCVVAKGVHAPIAAYESLGPQFVHVNTPGVTSADLTQFDYHNRRRPLFPFEDGWGQRTGRVTTTEHPSV